MSGFRNGGLGSDQDNSFTPSNAQVLISVRSSAEHGRSGTDNSYENEDEANEVNESHGNHGGGTESEHRHGGGMDDTIIATAGATDGHGHGLESSFEGGAGSDHIEGGDGNDHIWGNSHDLAGGALDGADDLKGWGGDDYIQGNAGADTIDGGSGNDRLYGGADNDLVTGGSGDDYLQGNKGADTLSGGTGRDQVHGGADNDKISGDSGDDQLFGDNGDDTIVGGTGVDHLTGGAGNDLFVFSGKDAAFTSLDHGAKVDEVIDFIHGQDHVSLDFLPAEVLTASADSASAALVQANQLLSAHAGQTDVAAVTVGNDTLLFWDSTGHGGAANSVVQFDHVSATTLASTDFI